VDRGGNYLEISRWEGVGSKQTWLNEGEGLQANAGALHLCHRATGPCGVHQVSSRSMSRASCSMKCPQEI
jgi:hypothetical protein